MPLQEQVAEAGRRKWETYKEKHPIIELIRNAMAKSGEKYEGGKLTRPPR
jgi:hypothetical protein